MSDALALWLNGVWIATLRRDRARLVLEYTDEAFERFPLGSPVLSLDLPMVRRRYTHGKVRPFVDGLLPEGDARRAIAGDLGLAFDDAYGLIGALGRDPAERARDRRSGGDVQARIGKPWEGTPPARGG